MPELPPALSLHTTILRWLGLLCLSVLAVAVFLAVHLSAGMMLGPMIAAIIVAVSGHGVRVPKSLFSLSQAIIACMVASGLSAPVLRDIVQHSGIMLFSVLSVVVVSFGTGAVLAYFRVVPGTSALWGSSPGGASMMTLMCEAFGADARLVAFMLYFRVILVAIATSVVARIVTAGHHVPYLPPSGVGDIYPTIALILGCSLLGPRLRIPAAPLLLTILLGTIAKLTGIFTVATPEWLRVPAYFLLGWTIGLRFTGPVLRHALSALPAVALSSTILILTCAALAFPVARLAHVDLLSAYLATSPGGLDTIVIISASIPVNLPFIVSLQTARMIAVIVLGPMIARPLGRWLEQHKRPQHISSQ